MLLKYQFKPVLQVQHLCHFISCFCVCLDIPVAKQQMWCFFFFFFFGFCCFVVFYVMIVQLILTICLQDAAMCARQSSIHFGLPAWLTFSGVDRDHLWLVPWLEFQKYSLN